MTQVDVTLTDYALALECAIFTFLLAPLRKSAPLVISWFMVFFSSIALAALAGGMVHGFFADTSSLGYRILWPLTMVLVGVTALSGVHIGTALQFTASTARHINRAAAGVFVVYCIVVLWISSDFLVAILDYLPAVVFVGVVFLLGYCRQERPSLLLGFFGICIMLLASGAQQAQIGISPRYFNYNSVYHSLQAIALFLIFIAARGSSRSQQT